jgi:DNA-binding NtrC family response regulator
VNVRVVVATNRNLKEMVEDGRFRADLYYRLRCLQLQIPPVRERGDDWELILGHYLERLAGPGRPRKSFSDEAMSLLKGHSWPGNVREIRGLVDTGFHLSDGPVIQPDDFAEALEEFSRARQVDAVVLSEAHARYARLIDRAGNFWELVQQPYLDRDLNRLEVRKIVAEGLSRSGGSYKKLLDHFGVDQTDYLKFMDFLRHHQLKPSD